jgi:hypothetical protein
MGDRISDVGPFDVRRTLSKWVDVNKVPFPSPAVNSVSRITKPSPRHSKVIEHYSTTNRHCPQGKNNGGAVSAPH